MIFIKCVMDVLQEFPLALLASYTHSVMLQQNCATGLLDICKRLHICRKCTQISEYAQYTVLQHTAYKHWAITGPLIE